MIADADSRTIAPARRRRAPLPAMRRRGGSTILLTNPFLGKAFPMRTAANATSLPLTSLSQKSPESPGACMQFARNNHICGGVYGIKDSQLGDGPMNLPLDLQRRLDRRWSARFRMSEQGLARSAVAHPCSKPNLRADLPAAAAYALSETASRDCDSTR